MDVNPLELAGEIASGHGTPVGSEDEGFQRRTGYVEEKLLQDDSDGDSEIDVLPPNVIRRLRQQALILPDSDSEDEYLTDEEEEARLVALAAAKLAFWKFCSRTGAVEGLYVGDDSLSLLSGAHYEKY